MRRTLIIVCLAAGCGLPELDTPATRAGAVAPYPDLAPRQEILSRVEADTATLAGAELSGRSAGLAAQGNAARSMAAADTSAILARADGLRARAQGLRDVATPSTAPSAALRERAATIRADQPPAAAVVAPAPTGSDAEAAERLRRLRDGTAEDPL
ncbi:hypothetical protein SAMN04488020_101346 [Palleronia marisminoris]|uniref:Uncharacterized protein n=1 Tax=Palleronia marisminoris TaxID=315423 RepID=A0A1Y5RES1_9RHOB|nr:hypothetical protein [Palleronia marisminoris]SFG15771.1 hypothetical protein SAMN04488020_101346 [Palleronia marisminoris]SLN15750.1 hypothetical protein PAM7066_00346 [Palleronia marisminoris]